MSGLDLSSETIKTLTFECTKHHRPVAIFSVHQCSDCVIPSRNLCEFIYDQILAEEGIPKFPFKEGAL